MFRDTLFAKPILEVAEREDAAFEVEIGAVHCGDGWIVAWPGEIFVDFGQALRAARPGERLLIGTLSGGTINCYVAPREAYPRGGYETLVSDKFHCAPGCGERIVQETVGLLARMDSAEK